MILRFLCLSLSLLVFCDSVAGHDVWIETKPDAIELGSLVHVELWQGHAQDAEPLPRNGTKLERFEALAPDGEVVELPGLHGRRPAGFFRPSTAGTWSLVYEGRPSLHRLGAERFERYLTEEGLDHVLEYRRLRLLQDQPGIELVSRSLKALVTVGESGLVDRPAGLPVELVLERSSPSEVGLRLFVDGEPAQGVLVDLEPLGPSSSEAGKRQARTAQEGTVTFQLDRDGFHSASEGRWVASAVVARALSAGKAPNVRSSPASEARWLTIFATLTFPISPAHSGGGEPFRHGAP